MAGPRAIADPRGAPWVCPDICPAALSAGRPDVGNGYTVRHAAFENAIVQEQRRPRR
jgi:hypothetical protein